MSVCNTNEDTLSPLFRSRTEGKKTLQRFRRAFLGCYWVRTPKPKIPKMTSNNILNEVKEMVMEEAKNNRTRLITLRLNREEYRQLESKFKATTCRKMSDYMRKVLLTGKVTVLIRNGSLDDFMAEMILLRNELSGIGSNFNQAVHYTALDNHGNKIGTPIKASAFYSKPTLKYLEQKYIQNESVRQVHQQRLKTAIKWVLVKEGISITDFVQALAKGFR